jgi:hypothetical protein
MADISSLCRFGAILSLSLVAACARTPVLPVTSLDGRACSDAPSVLGARPVALGGSATVIVDANAPCLQQADGGAAYTVFELPNNPEPILVTIASTPLDQCLFAPRALLLDPLGGVVREVPPESFMFHGLALKAGLRLRPGEHYLVVASYPAAVGHEGSQIVSGAHLSNVSVAAGAVVAGFKVYTGSEDVRGFLYTHNGRVVVTVQRMPAAN